jgi:cellulose synthase operon protein C
MTKKIRGILILAILPLLLLNDGAFGQASPAEAVALARKGEYAAAATALERAVNGGNVAPAVVEGLYYSWIRQGEYVKARDRFEAWAKSNPNAAPIRLAAARSNRITGNYAAALAHLNTIQTNAEVGLAARNEKAEVLVETGKREEADVIYKKTIDDYQKGLLKRNADQLFVALALRSADNYFDANETFKLIKRIDPQNAEAMVAWGDLLAYSTNEADAVLSYEDALAVDPNMPEALLGMARNITDDADTSDSEKAFKRALEVNPNSIEGHILEAAQQLDSEDYVKALASTDKVLAINPQSVQALSLVATVHYVRGETDEFNKSVQKVLSINPQSSGLYYTIASSCVSLRLYKEAVSFAREAVRLNPRDWQSMSVLGVNLLRIGLEDEGIATLEKINKADPYDVPTLNSLRLTDSWKDFDVITTDHFRIKLNKKESGALKPYVTDLLEKAYKTLSAKYEFTPEGPIGFEMYPNHEDFAVRTLGLPGLGALGVCFGKLVVMDSPTARKPDEFNWGSTLWHEFTHVITLQMTDHRIPRWFSEGLSVYEERKAYPGWGDDMKLQYLLAIKGKKLLPIADLNKGFFDGRILVSYYQASLVADYIEGKWGFPAIRKMLMLYKAGKGTADVFKDGLNISLEAFDTEFLKWVDAKAASINPDQYHKSFIEGTQALEDGDTDKAIKSLTSAVDMYPEYSDDANAYEPLIQAYVKKGDKKGAIDALNKFLTYSETSYPSYVLRSQLLEEAGDAAGAAKSMEGAMYVRPMELTGHEKLGVLLLQLKQYASAAREYETLLALNTTDRAGAYFHLAESKLGDGKKDEAYKNVMESLKIAPSYGPALALLLKTK